MLLQGYGWLVGRSVGQSVSQLDVTLSPEFEAGFR